MVWRWVVLIATGVVVGLLASLPGTVASPGTAASGAAWPPWARPGHAIARALLVQHPDLGPGPEPAPHQKPRPRPEPESPGGGLAGCEAGLERAQGPGGAGAPRVAIVGASFTAGVGPGNPDRAWAVLLARMEHWDAVVYGVPGAGYVRPGAGHKGPVAAELARVGLRALRPGLVIVQAGHDDFGMPPSLLRQRVTQAIGLIRAEAPRARIALITVFPGRAHAAAAEAYRTDQIIVTAAQAADPGVIIIDPLAGGWKFPHGHDGLHPTAGGDLWIATKVAGVLRGHGVLPAPAGRAPVICDSGIPVRPPPTR